MDLASKLAFWADRLRDLSAFGLLFSQDSYDRTRYRAIQDISLEMLALATGDTLESLEPLRDTLYARPTPLAVGDAAVIDRGGRILLMRRSDNQHWAMPGGALEVGETPAAGVMREVFEETGLRCRAVALVGVFDSRMWGFTSRHHLYAFTFLAELLEEAPVHFQSIETLDTDWFEENKLPESVHPGHLRRISEAFRVWRGDPRPYFDPSS